MVDLVIYGLIIWFAASGSLFAAYRRKNRHVELASTPVLLSYYTEGSQLHQAKRGKLGNLRYSAFIAINFYAEPGTPSSALLYRVELPFMTSIHLLGIPKKTGADRLDPTGGDSLMERVELEGKYSDYFDLFCEKGMQQTARYVLDPAAMVFTIDFCQSQNWEIVGNELYFVLGSNMKTDKNDPTYLIDDITKFVDEIRPAVEKPLTPQQRIALAPYGEDYRDNLKCPFCDSLLKNEDQFFSCPKGHGILLTGADLQAVKKGDLKLPATTAEPVERTTAIECPSCGYTMERVSYNGGPTLIDSCSNCPYRWLDPGEYALKDRLS